MTARGRRSRQAVRAAIEEREEALRGLCFCVLYDLCAWLTRARRPVPAGVREYRLQAPRRLAEPVDRMRLYLNPEVYFDYLRTCYPNFPIDYASGSHKYVPGRMPYGYSERIANTNVKSVSQQPFANANFPKNAKDPTGAACAGQVDRPGT